jgi:DNA-binding CsgD family transcriptional regulator
MPSKKRLAFSFFASLSCALIMLFEDIGEAIGVEWIERWDDIHVWEVLIMLSLFGAILVLGFEVWKMWNYKETLEDKVERASGAFEDLLCTYFEQWSFSDAEQDITRLLLKGCSIAEISEIRNAKEGTIKAQTNSIYKKSGYASKTQLLGAFIEDLTNGGSVAGQISVN